MEEMSDMPECVLLLFLLLPLLAYARCPKIDLPNSCSHVKGTTRVTRCSVALPSLVIALVLLLTLLVLASRCGCWH